MRLKTSLVATAIFVATTSIALAEPPEWSGNPDHNITIKTLPGMMRFDTPTLDLEPGKKVKLVIENPDDLEHNFVLLDLDPDDKDGAKFAETSFKLGEKGPAMAWTPDSPRVLAKSGMIGLKQSVDLYFVTPKKPGAYAYVCTIPGHALLMRGKLNVGMMKSPAKEVTYSIYKEKSLSKLPDFSKLTPVETGKAKNDILSIAKAKKLKDNFAIVWEGKFDVPKTENYEFFLGSDDGSRLSIDGEVEIDNDGIHPMKVVKKKVKLEKGEHTFRVTYFEGGGGEEFSLYANSKSRGEIYFSDEKTAKAAKKKLPPPPMLLKPLKPGEAITHRTFLGGGTQPRSIAVGYPGGINLAWSADTMNLNLIWRGGFVDVGGHWNGRGSGSKIAGFDQSKVVEGMAFQVLESLDEPWVKFSTDKLAYERDKTPEEQVNEIEIGVPHADYDFKGYRLDKNRFPTFSYGFQKLDITDRFDPGEIDGIEAIHRTISIKGTAGENTYFLIGNSGAFEEKDGWYSGEGIQIKVEGAETTVRESEGKELIALIKGDTELKVTYRWNEKIGGKAQ